MLPTPPDDTDLDHHSPNTRGRRAVALIVIAASTLGLAGTIYLRMTSGTHKPPSSARAVDRNLVSATAIEYDFVSPSVGWGLFTLYGSMYGVGAPYPLHFTVFRTTDGAKHWQRQLDGVVQASLGEPHSIQFVDESNGYLFLAGTPAQLFRTVDAGIHWLPVGNLPTTDVSQVEFTDPTHGWLVSGGQVPGQQFLRPLQGPPRLFATDDGGASWRTLPDAPSDAGAATFGNQTEEWMGGLGVGRPFVYASLNGGSTWQRRFLPSPPGQTWTADPSQNVLVLMPTTVDVLPGGRVVASVTNFGERYIFTTADTGMTWTYVPAPQGSITYVDSLDWWAVIDKRLYKTTDGGLSWAMVSNALPSSLSGVDVVDANHAWATESVDGGYGLVTSNDAGLHWNRTAVPNPNAK